MDYNKYNPLKPKVEEIPKLQSWKDSAPVVRLSEYLKMHKDQGIKLYQRDGSPFLLFEPGVRCDDLGRLKIVKAAALLLVDAADDLKYLLTNGLIDIPTKPAEVKPAINAAGPSQTSDLQGSKSPNNSLQLE